MTTVDQFLLKLNLIGIEHLNPSIPNRDKRILVSLSKQLTSGVFLTENQSRLLIKILKENSQYLDFDEMKTLDDPKWSQPYRTIDQVRKIYVKDSSLIVDFTFNKTVKKIMSDLIKTLEGAVLNPTPTMYIIPLTERNILSVITALKRERFAISTVVQDYFNAIKNIVDANTNPFTFEAIDTPRTVSLITSDIDITNPVARNDRRIRYQYFAHPLEHCYSLTEKIANRATNKVYINSETTSLSDLIKSLTELNRLPILVVFNAFDEAESLEKLVTLEAALRDNSVSKVGVYFRFTNSEVGKQFNDLVKQHGYNQRLDEHTQVVGVANNQLPKFLFKTNWYPQTVISLTANFRNNKTSVYSDAVDLIVLYNKTQPISSSNEIL